MRPILFYLTAILVTVVAVTIMIPIAVLIRAPYIMSGKDTVRRFVSDICEAFEIMWTRPNQHHPEGR